MDKEFEAFKNITEFIEHSEYYINCFNALKREYCQDKLKVEQALTELKAIKEAEPSEAMDYLEEIINYHTEPQYDVCENSYPNEFKDMWEKELNTIKQALIKAQEQEKVLEIIKEHLTFEDSGIEAVKDFINDKEETKYIIKVISKDTGATIHIHLDTKEEFELLKRWSNNE